MSTVDSDVLKKMEKTILSEGKDEEKAVKHAVKHLAHAEKSESKAHKAADKAGHTLEKAEENEHSTAKALNSATYKHNIAISNLKSAEKDIRLEQQRDDRLRQEAQEKKAQVNEAIQQREVHNEEREAKLADIHHKRADSAVSK